MQEVGLDSDREVDSTHAGPVAKLVPAHEMAAKTEMSAVSLAPLGLSREPRQRLGVRNAGPVFTWTYKRPPQKACVGMGLSARGDIVTVISEALLQHRDISPWFIPSEAEEVLHEYGWLHAETSHAQKYSAVLPGADATKHVEQISTQLPDIIHHTYIGAKWDHDNPGPAMDDAFHGVVPLQARTEHGGDDNNNNNSNCTAGQE
ncbi:uncharacterized protein B0I36DRAFT_353947 [Microdochium trichocladiopsis]|uniref:Uncharacterized protein n=1 Tax=Microdochium trichocladiopsis TaxID=1682393 RepID=A0A9P8XYB9_9PEZI|nr:uncharacterized protein B0I36DRAFT_353947 [Microdochium trichocladiopsis]KAH7021270.1 hypothetical protein B0I36DRAFT_353947 [Microdochium trichocladiopsis]